MFKNHLCFFQTQFQSPFRIDNIFLFPQTSHHPTEIALSDRRWMGVVVMELLRCNLDLLADHVNLKSSWPSLFLVQILKLIYADREETSGLYDENWLLQMSRHRVDALRSEFYNNPQLKKIITR